MRAIWVKMSALWSPAFSRRSSSANSYRIATSFSAYAHNR